MSGTGEREGRFRQNNTGAGIRTLPCSALGVSGKGSQQEPTIVNSFSAKEP